MRAAEEAYEGTTLELMERAGTAAADAVLSHYPGGRLVSVWCGGGSNGGDGLVIARKLREADREVEIRLIVPEDKLTGDAADNLRRVKEAGIPFTDDGGAGDLLVDALFGTGFSGKPRPESARAIDQLNRAGAPILAVDVPSGVDASTG